MRVFVDYRKKSVEFDVKETMTVSELKDRIESECTRISLLFFYS